MDALLMKIQDANLSEENLAKLAARVLNLGTFPIEAWDAFKEELSGDIYIELEERMQYD